MAVGYLLSQAIPHHDATRPGPFAPASVLARVKKTEIEMGRMRSRRPRLGLFLLLCGDRPQEEEPMRQAATVQMTLRIPVSTVDRIDGLAEEAGLTRAQVLRMLLRRASEADLPEGLVENADRLREARGLTR
jgi:hypothetical protein